MPEGPVTVTGTQGELRHGYRTVAKLKGWTLTRGECACEPASVELAALDAAREAGARLALRLEVGKFVWTYPAVELVSQGPADRRPVRRLAHCPRPGPPDEINRTAGTPMRFIQPETTKITLNGSDEWIEVKKELNVREQIELDTAGFSRKAGGEVAIDFPANVMARVLTYLVDWSEKRDISDESRKRYAIENLEPEDFNRIDQAIRAHIEAMSQEKNGRTDRPL